MKTYIVAEIGVNHNGDVVLAKALFDEALKAGAKAVKIQSFDADESIARQAKQAAYQSEGANKSQYELIKPLQLDFKAHLELQEYAQKLGLDFLSTPFDLKSLDLLVKLGLKTLKIPSGEITNLPLLEAVSKLNKRVIMSTGMSNMDEVRAAVKALEGCDELILLQANTQYPTPLEDANLLAMVSLGREFGLKYGYSDHTLGTTAAVVAVALGACVIEKHLTLDTSMQGPDHKSSATPKVFAKMVKLIKEVELVLGSPIKQVSPSEAENVDIARKVIVARKSIKKGEAFSKANLCAKRAGKGMSPMLLPRLYKEVAKKDYERDEII